MLRDVRQMECGCKSVITQHEGDKTIFCHVAQSISLQELEKDLGAASEHWFQELTSAHTLVPPDENDTLLPCPGQRVPKLHCEQTLPDILCDDCNQSGSICVGNVENYDTMAESSIDNSLLISLPISKSFDENVKEEVLGNLTGPLVSDLSFNSAGSLVWHTGDPALGVARAARHENSLSDKDDWAQSERGRACRRLFTPESSVCQSFLDLTIDEENDAEQQPSSSVTGFAGSPIHPSPAGIEHLVGGLKPDTVADRGCIKEDSAEDLNQEPLSPFDLSLVKTSTPRVQSFLASSSTVDKRRKERAVGGTLSTKEHCLLHSGLPLPLSYADQKDLAPNTAASQNKCKDTLLEPAQFFSEVASPVSRKSSSADYKLIQPRRLSPSLEGKLSSQNSAVAHALADFFNNSESVECQRKRPPSNPVRIHNVIDLDFSSSSSKVAEKDVYPNLSIAGRGDADSVAKHQPAQTPSSSELTQSDLRSTVQSSCASDSPKELTVKAGSGDSVLLAVQSRQTEVLAQVKPDSLCRQGFEHERKDEAGVVSENKALMAQTTETLSDSIAVRQQQVVSNHEKEAKSRADADRREDVEPQAASVTPVTGSGVQDECSKPNLASTFVPPGNSSPHIIVESTPTVQAVLPSGLQMKKAFCFIYPTSSQIEETSPQAVFAFRNYDSSLAHRVHGRAVLTKQTLTPSAATVVGPNTPLPTPKSAVFDIGVAATDAADFVRGEDGAATTEIACQAVTKCVGIDGLAAEELMLCEEAMALEEEPNWSLVEDCDFQGLTDEPGKCVSDIQDTAEIIVSKASLIGETVLAEKPMLVDMPMSVAKQDCLVQDPSKEPGRCSSIKKRVRFSEYVDVFSLSYEEKSQQIRHCQETKTDVSEVGALGNSISAIQNSLDGALENNISAERNSLDGAFKSSIGVKQNNLETSTSSKLALPQQEHIFQQNILIQAAEDVSEIPVAKDSMPVLKTCQSPRELLPAEDDCDAQQKNIKTNDKDLNQELLCDVDFSQELLSMSQMSSCMDTSSTLNYNGLKKGKTSKTEATKQTLKTSLSNCNTEVLQHDLPSLSEPSKNRNERILPSTVEETLAEHCSAEGAGVNDFAKGRAVTLGGFKTANGKDLVMSSCGLKRARELWKTVEEEQPTTNSVLSSDFNTVKPSSPGEHNSAKPSLSHLKTAKPSLLINCNEFQPLSLKADLDTVKTSSILNTSSSLVIDLDSAVSASVSFDIVGFKTAGGKSVSLSDKAKLRALEMWQTVGKEMSINATCPDSASELLAQDNLPAVQRIGESVSSENRNGEQLPSALSAVTESAGFQTASGKMFTLSANARQQAEAIWNCVGKDLITMFNTSDSSAVSSDVLSAPVAGRSDSAVDGSLLVKRQEQEIARRSDLAVGGSLLVQRQGQGVEKDSISFNKDRSSLPQGFRPFKPPAVVRKVEHNNKTLTDTRKGTELAAMTKEDSSPQGVNADCTKGPRKGGKAATDAALPLTGIFRKVVNNKSARRKHSDEFSGDEGEEQTWGIISEEFEMVEDKLSSQTVSQSTFDDQGLAKAGKYISDKNNICLTLNRPDFLEEVISDAVMKEMANELGEANVPFSHGKSAQTLHLNSEQKTVFEPRAIVSELASKSKARSLLPLSFASFESLRGSESVSHEENGFNRSLADLSASFNATDGEAVVGKYLIRVPKTSADKDSLDLNISIPEQIIDSTFSDENNSSNSKISEGRNLDGESSFVERSQLGFVWLDNHPADNIMEIDCGVLLDRSDDNAAVSEEFLKEEKAEVLDGDNFLEDSICIKKSSDRSIRNFAKDEQPHNSKRKLRSPTDLILSSHPAKRLKLLKCHKRVCFDTSVNKHDFIRNNDVNMKSSFEEISPVDSLVNLSWTEITSAINPSQWDADGIVENFSRESPPNETSAADGGQRTSTPFAHNDKEDNIEFVHINMGNDKSKSCTNLPIICTTLDNSGLEESRHTVDANQIKGNLPATCRKPDSCLQSRHVEAGEYLRGSSKQDIHLQGKEDTFNQGTAKQHLRERKEADFAQLPAPTQTEASAAAPDPWSDSEGFQVTNGLSQVFQTQVSQIWESRHPAKAGDLEPVGDPPSIYAESETDRNVQPLDVLLSQTSENILKNVTGICASPKHCEIKSIHSSAGKDLTSTFGQSMKVNGEDNKPSEKPVLQGFQTARRNNIPESKQHFISHTAAAENKRGHLSSNILCTSQLITTTSLAANDEEQEDELFKTDDAVILTRGTAKNAEFSSDSSASVSLSPTFSSARRRELEAEGKNLDFSSTCRQLNTSCMPMGFQTASGKTVSVSHDALRRSRLMMDSGDTEPKISEGVKSPEVLTTKMSAQGPVRFQSASGKSVYISDEALRKSKQILDFAEMDFAATGGCQPSAESKTLQISALTYVDFQAASGQIMGQSYDASKTSRQIRDTGERQPKKDEGDKSAEVLSTQRQLGFETLNKCIGFSDNTLKDNKQTFDFADLDLMATDGYQAATKSQKSAHLSLGFQTANGKVVNVSEKALKKSKELLDGLEIVQTTNDEDRTLKAIPPQTVADRKLGFQTASGKVVNVSEKALKKSKELLDALEIVQTTYDEDRTLKTIPFQNAGDRQLGFQTASGKVVNVSEKALKKSKELLDVPEIVQTTNDEDMIKALPPRTADDRQLGFKTASGKVVNVSDKALKKSKELLDVPELVQTTNDEDRTLEAIPPQTDAYRQLGFQTASGKNVIVSETALKESRKILDAAVSEEKVYNWPENVKSHQVSASSPVKDFCTAGGKSVSVSETSLSKVKGMWTSLTGDICPNSNTQKQPVTVAVDDEGSTSIGVSSGSVKQQQRGKLANAADASNQGHAGYRKDTFKTSSHEEEGNSKRGKGSSSIACPMVMGFQTAGGANVNISIKALQHIKNLFQDDTSLKSVMDVSELSDTCMNDPNSKAVVGVEGHSRDKGLISEVDTRNFLVSAVTSASSKVLAASGIHHRDSNLPIERRKRKCEESFQPMADSSREGAGVTKKPVIAVKAASETLQLQRTAVITDCEEFLYDRAPRGLKLLPEITSDEVLQPKQTQTLMPEVSRPPKCIGVSPSFQPPFKKPRFNPSPAVGKSTENKQATKAGFVPPVKRPCAEQRNCVPGLTAENVGSELNDKTSDQNGRLKMAVCNSETTLYHGKKCTRQLSRDERLDTKLYIDRLQPKLSEEEVSAEEGHISAAKSKRVQENFGQLNDISCMNQPMASSSKPNEPGSLKGSVPARTLLNEQSIRSDPLSKRYDQPRSSLPGQSQSFLQEPDQLDDTLQQIDQSGGEVGACLGVEEARLQQEKIVRQKKRQTVRPVAGRWMVHKASQQQQRKFSDLRLHFKWRTYKQLLALGVSPSVCSVSSRNAEEFRFHIPSFYPGTRASILIGDGALLVPDMRGYAGKEEFYRAFLTLVGVDPVLVSEAWVRNHYRWILWKLAAYEVALPLQFASRALTPDTVMYQLKYRYDREVDKCQRSALKRIVERDDAPGKRLVLCVADVRHSDDAQSTMLEVTDGWYSLPCKPDSALQELIDRKKLGVGQKFITTGAELAGSQEACTPLELTGGIHLKIWGNSTCRASGSSRLGYQRDPRPLCVPLCSLHAQGGVVGCVDVVVARKYPLMFMEKLEEGRCIFRTSEMEEREQQKHEESRQTCMEKLYSKLMAEMEKEDYDARCSNKKKTALKPSEVQNLATGAEISDVLEASSNPEELQSMLSGSQIERLMQHRLRQQEEQQQRLNRRLNDAMEQSSSQKTRNVVPLQKLRVVGCCRKDIDHKHGILLTVWRPDHDWTAVEEGRRYHIYSLTAAPSRSHSDGQPVELTAGRQTKVQSRRIDENLLDLVYEPREVFTVSELREKVPLFGEFDFVGLVISVKTALRSSDAVYAVDIDGGLVLIWFWGGLQTFNLQDMLKEGAAFSASNLRLKTCKRRALYVECSASLEMSAFSTSGKSSTQRQMLGRFKQKEVREQLLSQGKEKMTQTRPSRPPAEDVEDIPASFLDSLLAPLTQEMPPSVAASRTSPSPLSAAKHVHKTVVGVGSLPAFTCPNTKTVDTSGSVPTRQTAEFSSSSLASTSLNESLVNSPCDVSGSEDQSPAAQALRRKRRAQLEKLARLQSYGRAPGLAPLPSPVSPAAGRSFKPPTPCKK